MKKDPHESGQRLAAFAKTESSEEFLSALNFFLERAALPAALGKLRPGDIPVVYIVGAPRSGTTLLSQLLSRQLPVGYINNLIARFWLRPSVGIRLSQAVLGEGSRREISFRSTHGTTEGLASPHEFGYFWRHWLQLDQLPNHHLSEKALSRIDAAGLKHALEDEILAVFDCPVVFKNVICGFHASFLARLHSPALFIYMERDALATASSILKVRKERFGTYDVWWSLKPSTYPFRVPAGDPAAEVVMQVLECQREMKEELARPGVQTLQVKYKDLCQAPERVLAQVCDWMGCVGIAMRPCETEIGPLQASASSVPQLPAELSSRLQEVLSQGSLP